MWPVFILNAYWLEFDTFIHSLNLQSYAAFSFVFFENHRQYPPSFSTSSIISEEDSVNFYCRDNYILRLLITWYKYRAVHSVHSGSSYCNLIINLTHGFFYLIRRKTKLYVLHIKMKFNITRFFVSQNDFLASLLIIFLNTRKRQWSFI